jgi:membrane protein required for colicin V production
MNVLDYALMAFVALGAIHGIRQGALRMLTSVVSLGAAVYLAASHHARAGEFIAREFGAEPTVAAVLGYVSVFVAVFAAVQVVGMIAINLVHLVKMGLLDRLAGSLLGAAVASALAGVAVMLLAAILPPNAELLTDSQLAPELLAYNEMLVARIPAQAREAYDQSTVDRLRTWLRNEVTTLALPQAVSSNAAAEPAPSPASDGQH